MSPLELFRRNQKVTMTFLILLAMFAFVVLPTVSEYMRRSGPGMTDPVLAEFNGVSLTASRVNGFTQKHYATVQYLRKLAEETIRRGGMPQVPGFTFDQNSNQIQSVGINSSPSDDMSIRTLQFAAAAHLDRHQIAEAAVGAARAGAAIVHLHARDPRDGRPTQDPDLFREFLPMITAESDVVVNLTTGGAATMTTEEVTARGHELARRSRYPLGAFHPERFGFANPIPMSLHTRLMLIGTAIIMAVGTAGFALFEWRNPGTLGAMPTWEKAVQSVFSGGITPRTAGFNTVDYSLVVPETRLLSDALMFVGAGSGSTAGGLKVTTLMVLVVAARAEIRGHTDVNVLDRRIPNTTVRVAIAVTIVSLSAVLAGTMALLAMTGLNLDKALFETTSALATVGLSANVTPGLSEPAQILLVCLMFLGRVGPLTLASSLTLRNTSRYYRLPEGRPMIG